METFELTIICLVWNFIERLNILNVYHMKAIYQFPINIFRSYQK